MGMRLSTAGILGLIHQGCKDGLAEALRLTLSRQRLYGQGVCRVMRFIKTIFVGATLLLAVAAGPALGVAAKERKPIVTSAAGVSTIAIDNFGRVSATYYRGAQPGDRDFAELAALGVKTVIDLQEGGLASEPGLVERAGMKVRPDSHDHAQGPDQRPTGPVSCSSSMIPRVSRCTCTAPADVIARA